MKELLRVFVCLIILSLAAFAQKPTRDRGIELYQQGKNGEAIQTLEAFLTDKAAQGDADAWNYLGLSYFNESNFKKARKSLEKAVELQPQSSVYNSNLAYVYFSSGKIERDLRSADDALRFDQKNVTAHYVMGLSRFLERSLDEASASADTIISINPGYVQAYLLKSDVLLARLGDRVKAGSSVRDEIELLRQNVQLLEEGAQRSQKAETRKMLDERLEGARAFYEYYNKERPAKGFATPAPDPGVTPVKILNKPKAVYPDKARDACVNGEVRLAVLFGANAKIQHILVLRGAGYGLDEEAIKAARQIQFEPKTKDGKPVSTVLIFEYGFRCR